jgi:hypothetical protein
VFLIDMDSCSYGPRKHVRTSEFDDPLTPLGIDVDCYVDRYRAALLIARCLTGERDVTSVQSALVALPGPVPDRLLHMLVATSRVQRPTLTELADAFGASPTAAHRTPSGTATVDNTGVVGWRPRSARGRHPTAPAGTAGPSSNGRTPNRGSPPARPARPARPAGGSATPGGRPAGPGSRAPGPANAGPTQRPQPATSGPVGRASVPGQRSSPAPPAGSWNTGYVGAAAAPHRQGRTPPARPTGGSDATGVLSGIVGVCVIVVVILVIFLLCSIL